MNAVGDGEWKGGTMPVNSVKMLPPETETARAFAARYDKKEKGKK